MRGSVRPPRAAAVPVLLLAGLLMTVAPASGQDAPAPLELRVGDSWVPWRRVAPGAPEGPDTLLALAIRWREQGPDLSVGTFEVRTRGRLWRTGVALVEADPERLRFALLAADGTGRLSADEVLRGDGSVVLAVNTGLFSEDGTPRGLVVLEGARRSPVDARLDAVVAVVGGRVLLLERPAADSLGAEASAFQTVPWLVRGGRVVFGAAPPRSVLSRTHRDRRLTLCIGGGGRVRLLLSNHEAFGQAASRVPVGLTIPEQAAIALAAGCRDAVALDGGISAQLAVRGARAVHRMPGWRRVPLLLVAWPR